MKHKVKLIGVQGETVTLRVDGVLCSYLIQRPQPLDPTGLTSMMDTRLLELLFEVRPQSMLRRLLSRIVALLGPVGSRGRLIRCMSGDSIADYIEEVGVEVDIDEKTKGIVLLRSEVDKIRKDKL